MKAIICNKYGPPEVLQIKDIPKPVPKNNEVLIKIKATTVTIGDTIIRSGKHPDSKFYTLMMHLVFGLFRPKRKVLGFEFSGDIEAIGKDVTKFKVDDAVVVSTFSEKFGAHAEYKCMPENGMLVKKPTNLSYEEAATIPGGGTTALFVLKRARIRAGQKVLINGASGAVGTNAVQLAKYFGAEVTGVCSTKNLELVKSLGADHVIDYTKEDFTTSSETYHIIFDAVAKAKRSKAKKVLKKTGKYFNVLTDTGNKEKLEDLEFVTNLHASGKLKAVIDKTYAFENIAEAHHYVEKGHKKGNVAVHVSL